MLMAHYPELKTFGRTYIDLRTGRGIAVPDGMDAFAFEADGRTLPPVEEAFVYEVPDSLFDRLYGHAFRMETDEVRKMMSEIFTGNSEYEFI